MMFVTYLLPAFRRRDLLFRPTGAKRHSGRTLSIVFLSALAACSSSGGGDDDTTMPPPSSELPTLSISDAAVLEGDGTPSQLRFALVLTASTTQDVSARYATADGTATAGADYTASDGSVTIPAGSTSAEVAVPVLGDTSDEPDESMTVNLTDVSGARLLDGQATGTIVDDDITPLSAGRGLNDTGVTGCSTLSTNGLACGDSAAGTDEYPGQDAEVGRDVERSDETDGHVGFSWTKLDDQGTALSDQSVDYEQTPWPCIRDEVTGLIWEIKTNDDGLRDKDWSYSWLTSTGLDVGAGDAGRANGGVCVEEMSCDTDAYVHAVNDLSLCGYADWRLPSRSELLSIVDYSPPKAPVAPGGLTPFIDNAYFPNTSNVRDYWSRTDARRGVMKRSVSFKDGTSSSKSKAAALAVRLVRGGQ